MGCQPASWSRSNGPGWVERTQRGVEPLGLEAEVLVELVQGRNSEDVVALEGL